MWVYWGFQVCARVYLMFLFVCFWGFWWCDFDTKEKGKKKERFVIFLSSQSSFCCTKKKIISLVCLIITSTIGMCFFVCLIMVVTKQNPLIFFNGLFHLICISYHFFLGILKFYFFRIYNLSILPLMFKKEKCKEKKRK